jgi:hypothetical protein
MNRKNQLGTVAVVAVFGLILILSYFEASSLSRSQTSQGTSCLSTTQMQTTSTNGFLVLQMGSMPAVFSVGGYQFTTIYNGTGYSPSNNGQATVNLGWSLIYNISKGTQTQSVTFGWAPAGPMARLPAPSTSTLFNGAVHMVWVATCSSLFIEIDTQA